MAERVVETQQENVLHSEGVANSVQELLHKYGKLSAIIVGSVVLCIAIFAFYKSSQAGKQQKAALQLSRIQQYYESGDYANALAGVPNKTVRGEQILGLKAIAEEYSGVESGKLASLYAGQALLMQSNYTEAEHFFKIASEADAVIVKVGANAGLATCKDKSGNYAEGASLFEKAASLAKETGNEEHYRFYAGLLYEKANKKAEAVKIFKEIVATNEYSDFAGEAKAGLLRLGEKVE